MKILLLSDIHSNLVALETVLAAAPAHDAVWCLGDIVGYGPAPNECIERLRGLSVRSLAGNHDWAVLDKLDIADFNHNAQQAVLWTQDVLKPENRDWLAELPERQDLPDDNLTLVHGSPRYPIWEYIMTAGIAAENMSYFDTPVCLYGHTHVPMLYSTEEQGGRVRQEYLYPGDPLAPAPLGKSLINPGSVGQPRDRDPRASFALLDLDARTFTLYRVEYDIAATQAAMARAGLPRPLIERLSYGV